jgi:hypothetical protein
MGDTIFLSEGLCFKSMVNEYFRRIAQEDPDEEYFDKSVYKLFSRTVPRSKQIV